MILPITLKLNSPKHLHKFKSQEQSASQTHKKQPLIFRSSRHDAENKHENNGIEFIEVPPENGGFFDLISQLFDLIGNLFQTKGNPEEIPTETSPIDIEALIDQIDKSDKDANKVVDINPLINQLKQQLDESDEEALMALDAMLEDNPDLETLANEVSAEARLEMSHLLALWKEVNPNLSKDHLRQLIHIRLLNLQNRPSEN